MKSWQSRSMKKDSVPMKDISPRLSKTMTMLRDIPLRLLLNKRNSMQRTLSSDRKLLMLASILNSLRKRTRTTTSRSFSRQEERRSKSKNNRSLKIESHLVEHSKTSNPLTDEPLFLQKILLEYKNTNFL